WKVLVPLSFVNIMFIAIVLYYDLGRWVITILSLLSLAAAFWLVFNKHRSAKKHDTVQVYSVRELGLKKAEKPKLEEAAPDPQPAS
ncbi:MAG: hypothetical protein O2854_04260, partial [Chloroflexi bacterium]|nr:hypothetical protein [Chloroflexota bacterium]